MVQRALRFGTGFAFRMLVSLLMPTGGAGSGQSSVGQQQRGTDSGIRPVLFVPTPSVSPKRRTQEILSAGTGPPANVGHGRAWLSRSGTSGTLRLSIASTLAGPPDLSHSSTRGVPRTRVLQATSYGRAQTCNLQPCPIGSNRCNCRVCWARLICRRPRCCRGC